MEIYYWKKGGGDLINVDKMTPSYCSHALKMLIKYHMRTSREKQENEDVIYKAFSRVEDDECDATEIDLY